VARHAFSTIVSPILFLSAMGVALGTFVPTWPSSAASPTSLPRRPACWPRRRCRRRRSSRRGRCSPASSGLKTFQATIATPQGPRDIVLGHLYWQGVRLAS
jgi:hypothetical protein